MTRKLIFPLLVAFILVIGGMSGLARARATPPDNVPLAGQTTAFSSLRLRMTLLFVENVGQFASRQPG